MTVNDFVSAVPAASVATKVHAPPKVPLKPSAEDLEIYGSVLVFSFWLLLFFLFELRKLKFTQKQEASLVVSVINRLSLCQLLFP